jgi:hypothetical protein
MDERAAQTCVDAVLGDLMARAGFESWWEDIDSDTQQEIRESLASAIRAAARESGQ